MSVRTFASGDPEEQGLWDRMKGSLNERLESRQERRQEDMFTSMIDNLVRQKKYTIESFLNFNRESLEKSGADGWKGKLPWQQNKEGIEELRQSIKILETIPKHHRMRKRLKSVEMREYAEKAGVDYEQVRLLFYRVEKSQELHRWLRARKKSGASMPSSQADMSLMMQEFQVKLPYREKNKQAWGSLKSRYAQQ